MWPFLDSAICCAIKDHVEPVIQGNLPFPVSGFTFEKLAFGDAPPQIRGIKNTPLFSGTHIFPRTWTFKWEVLVHSPSNGDAQA
jgi:hypothetical protein